jgi:hypothetical protein
VPFTLHYLSQKVGCSCTDQHHGRAQHFANEEDNQRASYRHSSIVRIEPRGNLFMVCRTLEAGNQMAPDILDMRAEVTSQLANS